MAPEIAPDDFRTSLAFKEARESLKMTQQKMADSLLLGKGGARTVRRWELGERKIPGPAAAAVRLMLERAKLG